VNNQSGLGGARYRSSDGQSNYQLTGGAFVGARWLGVHLMNRGDAAVAFPGYSQFTRDRLRLAYDNYMAYTVEYWTSNSIRGHSNAWASRFWQNGDYLCGNTNAVYNAGKCGNTYAMYSHQKGYRTGTPEIVTVGPHDWFRQFTIYYARAQDRVTADYANFGRIIDNYCADYSVTCSYGAPWLSGANSKMVFLWLGASRSLLFTRTAGNTRPLK
jgi:hypothetical protein